MGVSIDQDAESKYLWVDELHDSLLEIIQVDGILCRGPSNDIVFIVTVSAECGKLFGIGKLDIDTILFHNTLNAAAADANDALVVRLGNMKRDFCGEFFLEQEQAGNDACVVAREIHQKVELVECLKLDLDIGHLHNLVNLSILLSAYKVAMFIGEFDLEANFVTKRLWGG